MFMGDIFAFRVSCYRPKFLILNPKHYLLRFKMSKVSEIVEKTVLKNKEIV